MQPRPRINLTLPCFGSFLAGRRRRHDDLYDRLLCPPYGGRAPSRRRARL